MNVEEHFVELKRLCQEDNRLGEEIRRLTEMILKRDRNPNRDTATSARLNELFDASSASSDAIRKVSRSLQDLCRGLAEWGSIDDL